MTLFFIKKPGGLDIPSLLGTATGLIAGLLAGEENFGKVLGSYIGVAVDGFSGGGGAVRHIMLCQNIKNYLTIIFCCRF